MSTKVLYICQVCGNQTHRWTGKCNSCGSWDSITGETATEHLINTQHNSEIKLSSLSDKNVEISSRFITKISELDRVFGGGIVLGSSTLVGGEPGVGKSTLLLQLTSILDKNFSKCLYVSGEESIDQIKIRADRLQITQSNIQLLSTSSLSDIILSLKKNKDFKCVVIDSIQTIYDSRISSSPGTVVQIRMCTHELITFTKQHNIILFILGQITKDGQIAGPKTLEHMVDTVLYFEGENNSQLRILRTVKNRFGPTNEIGVFEMSDKGLIPVKNPSYLFLAKSQNNNIVGSAVFAGIEGSRPILMEIQSLIANTNMVTPRRAVVGWDVNRLAMIIAVLTAKCNIFLGDKEVYLNIAGGLKICEPAADLAIAASLISSFINVAIPSSIIILGEIALSGEVRNISSIDSRLKEAHKLGFTKAIIPLNNKHVFTDINTVEIGHIKMLKKYLIEL
ncbi:DNA repair protein RadA [Ehrlichia canis]|uniref:DNA repair protein RadA n=1 Tax=Ehrlichia canis (strain Jake) TaxID=269484 RepID=A0ACA6AWB5_EHRCJ|nr:DNA repair protein RadA [Ehrlichia canis]AAZ68730.1 DNA repair protein RadA [Ehrlichia canis str. Jake]AUO54540.1 DNA repair protein RadA [Ehrlichia canis]UKC53143.1 radA [Ehrlichia canis]UKC54080.1 radA [Ehrlichia canis]UKC55016.1 radA [Ehrlichia canis]